MDKKYHTASLPGLLMRHLMAVLLLCCLPGCSSPSGTAVEEETYTNPIFRQNQRPWVTYHDGMYYFVQVAQQSIFIIASPDPTSFRVRDRVLACEIGKQYGLFHMWRPQLVFIDGTCYIYVTADDGNTDNHQLYVLTNNSGDPLDGEFGMLGRLVTDSENNWAIHAHVFEHAGHWYITWTGWETPRIFAENQCIYIARLADPQTLATGRVKISQPEYEWERQWVEPDGNSQTSYPVYVNEAPFFFCNQMTDRAYIYYSASATWTPYYAVGQLSAPKDSELLDPASWRKEPVPVFSASKEANLYSTGPVCIVPSPDGTEYYLIYAARPEQLRAFFPPKNVYMQPITFDGNGTPDLGKPLDPETRLKKPSGTPATVFQPET
ncbi:MAG: glycoside hydrolase family 43 protein [Alistipes sp.]|nr:glycoside hydrolase family 43 protein [Alistipes sp.]